MRLEGDGCRSTEVRTPLSEMTSVSIGDFSHKLHRHFCFDLRTFRSLPRPAGARGGARPAGRAARRSVRRRGGREGARGPRPRRGDRFDSELCRRADITCREKGRRSAGGRSIRVRRAPGGAPIRPAGARTARGAPPAPPAEESAPESAGLSTRRPRHTNGGRSLRAPKERRRRRAGGAAGRDAEGRGAAAGAPESGRGPRLARREDRATIREPRESDGARGARRARRESKSRTRIVIARRFSSRLRVPRDDSTDDDDDDDDDR